jgi:hypothetical protein
VAAEAMWDSAVEGDTDEEQEAQPKRSRGRPNGGKSRKTAPEQLMDPDALTTADPNEAIITNLEARRQRSARGRAVFALTFFPYDCKGMDERMVQYMLEEYAILIMYTIHSIALSASRSLRDLDALSIHAFILPS